MTGTSSGLKRDTAAGRFSPGLPAAPSPLDPYEYGADAGLIEQRLWCSVLMYLVDDARAYWNGKHYGPMSIPDYEQAFDDLMRCGPMVRYVCSFTGHDPELICQGFVRWCETDMA